MNSDCEIYLEIPAIEIEENTILTDLIILKESDCGTIRAKLGGIEYEQRIDGFSRSKLFWGINQLAKKMPLEYSEGVYKKIWEIIFTM